MLGLLGTNRWNFEKFEKSGSGIEVCALGAFSLADSPGRFTGTLVRKEGLS